MSASCGSLHESRRPHHRGPDTALRLLEPLGPHPASDNIFVSILPSLHTLALVLFKRSYILEYGGVLVVCGAVCLHAALLYIQYSESTVTVKYSWAHINRIRLLACFNCQRYKTRWAFIQEYHPSYLHWSLGLSNWVFKISQSIMTVERPVKRGIIIELWEQEHVTTDDYLTAGGEDWERGYWPPTVRINIFYLLWSHNTPWHKSPYMFTFKTNNSTASFILDLDHTLHALQYSIQDPTTWAPSGHEMLCLVPSLFWETVWERN